MSLTDGMTKKDRERASTAPLIEAYLQRGGSIGRDVGQKVTVNCTICSLAQMISASWVLRNGNKHTCPRCGGRAVVMW